MVLIPGSYRENGYQITELELVGGWSLRVIYCYREVGELRAMVRVLGFIGAERTKDCNAGDC